MVFLGCGQITVKVYFLWVLSHEGSSVGLSKEKIALLQGVVWTVTLSVSLVSYGSAVCMPYHMT